jgi:hypothetical protein
VAVSLDIILGRAAIVFIAVIFFTFAYFRSLKKLPPPALVSDTFSASGAIPEGERGDARTCPICAARFEHGETVKSKIFLPLPGRFDRLLHITGCPFCLQGERERKCPVCGGALSPDDYLVARIWQRPGKSHVSVQGCVRCLVGRGRSG